MVFVYDRKKRAIDNGTKVKITEQKYNGGDAKRFFAG